LNGLPENLALDPVEVKKPLPLGGGSSLRGRSGFDGDAVNLRVHVEVPSASLKRWNVITANTALPIAA